MAASPTENDDRVRDEAYRIHDLMVPQARVRQLSKRDNLRGGLHAVGHLALVAFLAYWSLVHGSLVAFGLQAFVMAFLFNGEHEFVHRTVFQSPVWLNDVFANIYGLLTMRPPRHYKFYHFNHHKFTGDPATDPELQDSFIDLKLDNPLSYALYLSGLPFWLDRTTTLIRHAALSWVLPREALFLTAVTRPQMIVEARYFVLAYALAAVVAATSATGYQVVVWGWAVPSLCAQPFLRFYLIAEHTGCAVGSANMLSNTRTTKTWAWYRWLAWNMPYHAEHHAYPTVPFHRLGELHDILKQQVAHRHCTPTGENGYLGVHLGIIRKFWSSQKA